MASDEGGGGWFSAAATVATEAGKTPASAEVGCKSLEPDLV